MFMCHSGNEVYTYPASQRKDNSKWYSSYMETRSYQHHKCDWWKSILRHFCFLKLTSHKLKLNKNFKFSSSVSRAMFQGLSSHLWLAAAILGRAALVNFYAEGSCLYLSWPAPHRAEKGGRGDRSSKRHALLLTPCPSTLRCSEQKYQGVLVAFS